MRWQRRSKVFQVGVLDRLMAEADAIRRAVDQGYRHPVLRSSERIFDLEGRPVWEIEISVRPRSKVDPR